MTQSARLTREPAARRRTCRLLGLTLILLALVLAILACASVSLAGSAKPGTPTAKTPVGTTATATPTFTWSKAVGAATYELRVYQGSALVFAKSGITKVSWKSTAALPTNVPLTWKVRAANASGFGVMIAGVSARRKGLRGPAG